MTRRLRLLLLIALLLFVAMMAARSRGDELYGLVTQLAASH